MKESSGEKSNACTQDGNTYLQMILSVRMMRLVMPLFSFLLIWSATHTGVSGRARVTGVSPSRFMMSMSAPLDRNNLETKKLNVLRHSSHHHRFILARFVQFFVHSRDTLQVSLPGGDVQRRVSVHVHRRQGAAGVQHQLGDVHAASVRRPVETHVQLLEWATRRVGFYF